MSTVKITGDIMIMYTRFKRIDFSYSFHLYVQKLTMEGDGQDNLFDFSNHFIMYMHIKLCHTPQIYTKGMEQL